MLSGLKPPQVSVVSGRHMPLSQIRSSGHSSVQALPIAPQLPASLVSPPVPPVWLLPPLLAPPVSVVPPEPPVLEPPVPEPPVLEPSVLASPVLASAWLPPLFEMPPVPESLVELSPSSPPHCQVSKPHKTIAAHRFAIAPTPCTRTASTPSV